MTHITSTEEEFGVVLYTLNKVKEFSKTAAKVGHAENIAVAAIWRTYGTLGNIRIVLNCGGVELAEVRVFSRFS